MRMTAKEIRNRVMNTQKPMISRMRRATAATRMAMDARKPAANLSVPFIGSGVFSDVITLLQSAEMKGFRIVAGTVRERIGDDDAPLLKAPPHSGDSLLGCSYAHAG